MASPDRPPSPSVDPLAAIRAEPFRFGLFHALRLIECAHPSAPRLGRTGSRAADEPVRLAQEPTLAFPPASLAGMDVEEGDESAHRPRLRVHGFGLFGPQGPLPLHLTEHLLERRRFHDDDTLARFADVFHHRLLSLFYRAWADCEPTVSHDRPQDDPFAGHLASLVGLGMASLRDRDALPDAVKLHFAGRLVGQARNPEGLCAMVAGFFGAPAAVEEFVRAWIPLPPEARWRLGDRRAGPLGDGPTIGARVLEGQHRFRILLGPLGFADYCRMLPGAAGLDRLIGLVRGYAGDEWAWELRLTLRAAEVPPFRLDGFSRLGWTSWLTSWDQRDADDLVFEPLSAAARHGRAAMHAGV